jgi:hypothetical protein
VQLIAIDPKTGWHLGATDPRTDGLAVGYRGVPRLRSTEITGRRWERPSDRGARRADRPRCSERVP